MLREFIRSHWRDVLSAAFVSVLIAIVGAFISWRQLRYYQKRDAKLDARNQWEKIHRAMMEFRFRREILNSPMGLSNEDLIQTSHALHMLRAELDRSPESPLVAEIANYLIANLMAEKWRADAFVAGFDNLVHQVVLNCRE